MDRGPGLTPFILRDAGGIWTLLTPHFRVVGLPRGAFSEDPWLEPTSLRSAPDGSEFCLASVILRDTIGNTEPGDLRLSNSRV